MVAHRLHRLAAAASTGSIGRHPVGVHRRSPVDRHGRMDGRRPGAAHRAPRRPRRRHRARGRRVVRQGGIMTVTDAGTVADYWREMVTVALLGTDRRDPPSPLAGWARRSRRRRSAAHAIAAPAAAGGRVRRGATCRRAARSPARRCSPRPTTIPVRSHRLLPPPRGVGSSAIGRCWKTNGCSR